MGLWRKEEGWFSFWGGSAWQAWHCIGSCLFGIVTGSSRCIGEGQRPDCMDRYGHRPLCTAAAVSCRPAASCCVRPVASYCMRPACRSLARGQLLCEARGQLLYEARVPFIVWGPRAVHCLRPACRSLARGQLLCEARGQLLYEARVPFIVWGPRAVHCLRPACRSLFEARGHLLCEARGLRVNGSADIWVSGQRCGLSAWFCSSVGLGPAALHAS